MLPHIRLATVNAFLQTWGGWELRDFSKTFQSGQWFPTHPFHIGNASCTVAVWGRLETLSEEMLSQVGGFQGSLPMGNRPRSGASIF